MTQLVRYEQARNALAECQRVDEVKDIRDKAEAMAAYARQAKDTEMIQWATEIKVRAERRAGEMLAQVPREQHSGRPPKNSSDRQTNYQAALEQAGISQTAAYQYERLASMPEEHFETAVATAKDTAGQVTTAFMLREAQKNKGIPAKRLSKADKTRLKDLAEVRAKNTSMLSMYARLTLTALRGQDEFSGEELSLLQELSEAIQEVSN